MSQPISPTRHASSGSGDLDAVLTTSLHAALSDPRDAGRVSFNAWCKATKTTADDAGWTLFASESAFAAVARAAVEARSEGVAHDHLLPHLFSSELFSWHRPPDPQELLDALSSQDAVDPIELLGGIYQCTVPATTRKRFGHFYTPSPVVESMLDSIHFEGPEILGRRIIDPAVGAGAFVIAAAKRLIQEAERNDLSGGQIWSAVQGAIFGLDVNPLGVLLTEAAIGLMLCDHLSGGETGELRPLHLYVTDSLNFGGRDLETERADEVEDIKGRSGAYADGFDYVVANPPYAKYPSRLLTDSQRRRFAATTYGHPNLYGLFLQVGVELLSDEGRLAFITPKSFVSGLYFRNLRRYLTKNLDLMRFDTFHQRRGVFQDVLQDVVILSAKHRGSGEQRPLIEIREFAGLPTNPRRSIQVESSSVLLGDRFSDAFFVDADELAHRLLARMSMGSVALSDMGIRVATGTVVWNRLKEQMRDREGVDALPLIWGNGIRRFQFLGLGNREGKAAFVALDDKTKGIITRGDALLVKRMTAKEESRRIVACRVPSELAESGGYFAENHVNLLFADEEAGIELDAVLGLLNSALFDYVFRALNGNTQVSATELAMLPIRPGPQLQAIAAQTRKLTMSGGAHSEASMRIEELVGQLYRLGQNEQVTLAQAYAAAG